VSSTSVYGQSEGEWVDEDSIAQPDNVTGQLIRQAEQKLMDLAPGNIVVRFSGIYGPGREYLLRMAMQTPAIQKTPSYFTTAFISGTVLACWHFYWNAAWRVLLWSNAI